MYLPIFRNGEQGRQNPIRLKNLLREAKKTIVARGMHEPEATKLLGDSEALLYDVGFWKDTCDGLAVFVSPAGTRFFRLPARFSDAVRVGERFHIRLLLPLVGENERFFVLAASHDKVRFFQATRWQIAEVQLPGFPQGVDAALHFDRPQATRQFHSVASGKHSRKVSAFHGHGGVSESDKNDLLLFFRQVDQALHKSLEQETAPMVFAGVDYLFPIFQKANTYPHLVSNHIPGNPDLASEADLGEKGWPCVYSTFEERERKAVERYSRLSGTSQVSSDVHEILVAACQGRVESLFVDSQRDLWGIMDAGSGRLQLTGRQPDSDDLIDLAASQTLLHWGAVYPLPAAKMPEQQILAAILRYKI
jgi:hypothetical protein